MMMRIFFALWVSVSVVSLAEDQKARVNLEDWKKAAAEIKFDDLLKEVSAASEVFIYQSGKLRKASGITPIKASQTEAGLLTYSNQAVFSTDPEAPKGNQDNAKLYRQVLIKLLAQSKDFDAEKKAAVETVASGILSRNYGMTLEEIAPSASMIFEGAGGLPGEHGSASGHSELPLSSSSERLLSFLKDPKSWEPATDCTDGKCKVISGQYSSKKLGGNIVVSDAAKQGLLGELPASTANEAAPAKTGTKSNPTYSQDAIAKALDEAAAAGKDYLIVKFGGEGWCSACDAYSGPFSEFSDDRVFKASFNVMKGNDPFWEYAKELKKGEDALVPLTVVYNVQARRNIFYGQGNYGSPQKIKEFLEKAIQSQAGKKE